MAIAIHCTTQQEVGDVWRMLRRQEQIHAAAVVLNGRELWTAFRIDGDRWSTQRADQMGRVLPVFAA